MQNDSLCLRHIGRTRPGRILTFTIIGFKLPLLIWASSEGKLALKIQFQKQAHY